VSRTLCPKRGVVEEWLEVLNREDADLIASYYNKDAVNHRVAEEFNEDIGIHFDF
jgi:ketosteroid isomerase-like protein